MSDCIFCKIAKKESPASIEAETDSVIAFANINPVSETHILIIPKKHVETFLDLDDLLLEMKSVADGLIKSNGIESAYKLVFNGGKYQAVPHAHWHLLGGKLEDNEDVLNKL